MCVYIYIYVYICMCVYIYVYMCVCLCVCCVCVCVGVYLCIYVWVCIMKLTNCSSVFKVSMQLCKFFYINTAFYFFSAVNILLLNKYNIFYYKIYYLLIINKNVYCK